MSKVPEEKKETKEKEFVSEKKDKGESAIQDEKIWALLSYLSILCFIPLLMKRENKFVQFHAKQGLVMFIAEFLIWIPILGWLLGIFIFVVWIIALIKVLNGEYWKIPVIGNIAERIRL